MKYKIIFSDLGARIEVPVTEEELLAVLPDVEERQVVKIGEGYYNASNFIKAVPDDAANASERLAKLVVK